MRAESVRVTIVAANAETLDSLQGYLSRVGLGVRGTRELAGADTDPCSVVIFFPDDFSKEDVLTELRRLCRERPSVLPLVVTGEPARYAEIAEIEGKGHAPVVLLRPAWGWTILDAIREAMDSHESE